MPPHDHHQAGPIRRAVHRTAATRPLLALRDGDAIVVVASNFGRPEDPAWCRNLGAQPRAWAELDGVRRAVDARELDGAERDRWFEHAVAIYPGLARTSA
jgi:deazaflavin-dependent oxidoreductase (nitroreductase family)